jgi:hypothetical protein
MRRRRTTVVVGVALAVGASLMSMTAHASLAATSRACSVLDRRRIEHVVGGPVTKSAHRQPAPPKASICNWDVDGADSGKIVSVFVQTGDLAAGGFRTAKKAFAPSGEPIAGLGRQSFYAADVGSLYALRHGRLLYVQNLDATGATDPGVLRAQTITLAKAAIGEL